MYLAFKTKDKFVKKFLFIIFFILSTFYIFSQNSNSEGDELIFSCMQGDVTPLFKGV